VIKIGQSEIIDFLKECKEPVTRKQIAEGLEYDPIRVSRLLRRLVNFQEVDYIEYSRDKASELVGYILLRRTRFFFIVKDL